MISLSLSEAFEFVRKSLDELDMSDNLAASLLEEDKDLYALVKSTIVEVALDIHTQAPAHLVSGIKDGLGFGDDKKDYFRFDKSEDKSVGELTTKQDIARLVSIHIPSRKVVTEFFTEDSVEAHKQLNQYTKGTPDRPRVILAKGSAHKPKFYYYSLDTGDDSMEVEYIPYPKVESESIFVSYQLKYPLLYWLVAEILTIVNEPDKAQIWKSKFKVE